MKEKQETFKLTFVDAMKANNAKPVRVTHWPRAHDVYTLLNVFIYGLL